MLFDPSLKLFFTFLTPLVKDMETLNVKFQTGSPDVDELLHLLELHFGALQARVFEPNGHILRCDYGASFEERAQGLNPDIVRMLKEKC